MSVVEQPHLPIACDVEGCPNPPAQSGDRTMAKCLSHLLGGGEKPTTTTKPKQRRFAR